VICTKCQTPNPAGAINCSSCSSPLADTGETLLQANSEETLVSSGGDDETEISGATEWIAAEAPAGGNILEPGSTLGNRYEILELLGEGGMGAVYKAKDLEVDRIVALKIVRPELAGSPEILRRFKQELVLARQITHRNVIRIFDLGVADGMRFISMEYIEGQDLATLLEDRGKYAPRDAAEIMRQVIDGLFEAHGQGVVHRDLKPRNFMVDAEGKVSIMDFGIAGTSLQLAATPAPTATDDSATEPGSAGLTQVGTLLGTPRYMSPEQAKGEKVDTRSDLFTTGIIFYELLTGTLPFAADSAAETMRKRIEDEPAPPIDLDPEIPKELNAIVLKCLRTDPEERYQSAQELLADLDKWLHPPKLMGKWQWAAVGVMAASVVTTGILWWQYGGGVPEEREPIQVLVADFENTTSESVFDGTLEPMFDVALEGASFVTAYSRAQARELAAEVAPQATTLDEETARLVAVREGISAVVTGSINRAGDRFGVSVRAVDAVTGDTLQSRNVNGLSRDEVLSAVAGLAAPIRRALGDETPESAQLTAAETFTTSSLEAAHAYSEAQNLVSQGQTDDAIRYYQSAIELDPDLGRAYAGLAVASLNLRRRDEAEKYYERTLELLDRMSERERYRTLGTYYGAYLGNLPQAIDAYRTLVSAYPADAVGWNNLSIAYLLSLNVPDAAEAAHRALDLEPRSVQTRMFYSQCLMYAADFENAVAEAQRVIEENPSYEYAYLPLALSTLAFGDVEGARSVYEQLAGLSPEGYSMAMMGKADLEMYLGRLPQALELLDKGAAADAEREATGDLALKYVAIAEAHLGMDNPAQAIEFAERAAQLVSVESVLLPAARVLVEAGEEAGARKIAGDLDNMLQSQTTSYARLIQGEIALRNRRFADAVTALQEAQKLHDSWLSHYLLGRVYMEAGRFAEALGQFDTCYSRRGESTDLMIADTSTMRYLPPLYYWHGRAQASMGMASAARQNFQQYVTVREGSSPTDPLLDDARDRAGDAPVAAGIGRDSAER